MSCTSKSIISFSHENINELINRTILIDDIPFVVDYVLDGPAKNAGLIKGDVLTSVNGVPLSGRQQFVSAFQKNENKTREGEKRTERSTAFALHESSRQ